MAYKNALQLQSLLNSNRFFCINKLPQHSKLYHRNLQNRKPYFNNQFIRKLPRSPRLYIKIDNSLLRVHFVKFSEYLVTYGIFIIFGGVVYIFLKNKYENFMRKLPSLPNVKVTEWLPGTEQWHNLYKTVSNIKNRLLGDDIMKASRAWFWWSVEKSFDGAKACKSISSKAKDRLLSEDTMKVPRIWFWWSVEKSYDGAKACKSFTTQLSKWFIKSESVSPTNQLKEKTEDVSEEPKDSASSEK